VTYAPDEPALRDRWGSRPRPERPGGACAAARHRPASPVMPSPLTRRSSRPAINHAVAALRRQHR